MPLLVATIIFRNFSSKVLKVYHQLIFFQFWKSVIKYWPVHGNFHWDIQNKMAGNNGTAPLHKRDYKTENSIYIFFLFIFLIFIFLIIIIIIIIIIIVVIIIIIIVIIIIIILFKFFTLFSKWGNILFLCII